MIKTGRRPQVGSDMFYALREYADAVDRPTKWLELRVYTHVSERPVRKPRWTGHLTARRAMCRQPPIEREPVRVSIAPCLMAIACLPAYAMAQNNPVADAFKENAKHEGTNLVAAIDAFPADKYSYKPTPGQMSVGDI